MVGTQMKMMDKIRKEYMVSKKLIVEDHNAKIEAEKQQKEE